MGTRGERRRGIVSRVFFHVVHVSVSTLLRSEPNQPSYLHFVKSLPCVSQEMSMVSSDVGLISVLSSLGQLAGLPRVYNTVCSFPHYPSLPHSQGSPLQNTVSSDAAACGKVRCLHGLSSNHRGLGAWAGLTVA